MALNKDIINIKNKKRQNCLTKKYASVYYDTESYLTQSRDLFPCGGTVQNKYHSTPAREQIMKSSLNYFLRLY